MSNPIDVLKELRIQNTELNDMLNSIEKIDKTYEAGDFNPFRSQPSGVTASSNFSVSFTSPSATSVSIESINNNSEQSKQSKQSNARSKK